jgi:thiosulfate dehydrogenase (quinone) large subunit
MPIGFKTELVAKLCGYLLLLFALAMAFSTGIKSAFDYSVFAALAAAFALSTMKEKYLEIDAVFK